MLKLLPTTLIVAGVALLAFAFTLPTPQTTQLAAVGITSTPSVFFTQDEVQTKEGSTVYLKVKLDTPVTKTTKVTIKLTGDQGTTSRDVPGLTGTKTVTFYKNGSTSKTVAIRTSRTTAEGDKALTAAITKIGDAAVQGDTVRVVVKDQKGSDSIVGGILPVIPATEVFEKSGCVPPSGASVSLDNEKFSSWPKYNYAARTISRDGNDLKSFKFVATPNPSNAYYGTISTSGFPMPNDGGFNGVGVSTISKTPGCVDSQKLLPGCVGKPAMWPGVSWRLLPYTSRGVYDTSAYVCPLTRGETYYMNLYWGGNATEGNSTNTLPYCPSGGCGRDFGIIQQ